MTRDRNSDSATSQAACESEKHRPAHLPDVEKHAASQSSSPDIQDSPRSTSTQESKVSAGPTTPTLSKARLITLVAILTGASFINTTTGQSAVIILPTISRDYSIPAPRQQWVVSAYSLTFATFLLLWSRLADVYGRKRIFVLGSLLVTLFTLVTPFAPNEIAFDVFRGVQGVGAAANVPTAIGILGATVPDGRQKMYAVSAFSAGFPLGSVMGNILGGVLGQYAGWRWVYWLLAILMLLITVAGCLVIPPAPESSNLNHSDVDWFGGVTITVALLLLLFALTEGNVVGWSTPYIPVLIVVALLLVGCFVVWQWYQEHHLSERYRPLMKTSIWRNKRFSAAQATQFLFFGAFNNFLVYATFFYQDYQGISVIQTTLRFIPTGVVGVTVSLVSSQILGRVRGVYILVVGTVCVSISALLFAVPIPTNETYWAYGFPAMCLSVLGADTVYPCLTLFTVQSLPKEDQAMGGGIINASGQLGRSIWLAVATATQVAVQRKMQDTSAEDPGAALLQGYRAAEYLSFGLGLTAAITSLVFFRSAGIVGSRAKG